MFDRTKTFAFLLALLAAGAARADDFDAASGAMKKGDYAAAFKLLKPLAEKGDARAQAELGALYTVGHGAPANANEALKWTKLAAEHGNAGAQANLGTMYLEGQVVQRDYKDAMKWSLLAAEQGVAAAQANIASMFYDGSGVAQDYKEAARWMRLAAEKGDPESQINLGTMYVVGQGVERDALRGYMWTSLGLESLPMSLSEKKAVQDMSAKVLSAEDVAKAQAMAKTCKESKFRNCE